MKLKSPWLNFQRQAWPTLKSDLDSEITIIGGGISGISTLYFLLMSTNKNIILVEKKTIASGATGHNAGLVVAHIEKSVSELVSEFGIEQTWQALLEIDEAWDLMLEIQRKIGGENNLVPFPSVTIGFDSIDNLLGSLEEERIQKQFSRNKWQYLVSDEQRFKDQIPPEFSSYVKFVSHEHILKTLTAVDRRFIAAAIPNKPFRNARINSAKFCHQVLHYLQEEFPHRFSIYENTEISQIELANKKQVLKHPFGVIHTQEVILCTNGYKDFIIQDQSTQLPFSKLHDSIVSREGYMIAYPQQIAEEYVRAFFNSDGTYLDVPYWYLSHAPLLGQMHDYYTFIGGPEYDLPYPCPSELKVQHATASLDVSKQFLKKTFGEKAPDFEYFWNGTMGYTKTGLRWIGQDPQHPHLWYNLGCNGIGILPAIGGGKKIARLMNGEVLESSIFDPP